MEIKKCEKNEKNISDDLKKNKSSFKKPLQQPQPSVQTQKERSRSRATFFFAVIPIPK
jgi:hypothetical protein